jgi:hypothetical protein
MDDPDERFRHWATVLFVVSTAIGILGLVLALVVATDIPFVERSIFVGLDVVLLVACVALVRGLRSREPWATDAALACNWIILVIGLARAVLALGNATVLIPLDTIVAIFVITRRPAGMRAPLSSGWAGPLSVLVTLAFALTQGASLLAGTLQRGTFLSADQQDLAVDIGVECSAAGPDGAPASIFLTSSWDWSRRDPFPGSTDGLVFLWSDTASDGGGGSGYRFAKAIDLREERGFWPGAGTPSADLIGSTAGDRPSFDVGIDLAKQQMAPGRITIELARVSGTATPHGYLSASAAYVHLGRWAQRSGESSCEW